MTQKQFVIVALDTIRADLEKAEQCLANDEPFNALTYLSCMGKSVLTAIVHLHISTHNPL